MDSIDQQVLKQLVAWLNDAQQCWLCTIVKTVGSSPRPVGSLLACNDKGQVVGSLSGGCVEDDLIEKILKAELAQGKPQCVKYGVTAEENERLGLPCGGSLHVLIESIDPGQLEQFTLINEALSDRQCSERTLDLDTGKFAIRQVEQYHALQYDNATLTQVFGPRYLMLLVGAGQLSVCLAQMATMLDYRVIVCDPRKELVADWPLTDVEVRQGMPDDVVRDIVRDRHSIVITLTHDPRIDDMALMEALGSEAFYIGALGSARTSDKRRERLQQLGLTAEQLSRLHAPVGLSIGSKTPPEIAISILAQLTRLRKA